MWDKCLLEVGHYLLGVNMWVIRLNLWDINVGHSGSAVYRWVILWVNRDRWDIYLICLLYAHNTVIRVKPKVLLATLFASIAHKDNICGSNGCGSRNDALRPIRTHHKPYSNTQKLFKALRTHERRSKNYTLSSQP